MLVVVSVEGEVLAVMTSGVDAHMIQKSHPGSRIYRCSANTTDVTQVAGDPVRCVQTDDNVCMFSKVNQPCTDSDSDLDLNSDPDPDSNLDTHGCHDSTNVR